MEENMKRKTHWIENPNETCFIADIAANHDGDLSRAIDLIYLAKQAGGLTDEMFYENPLQSNRSRNYGEM